MYAHVSHAAATELPPPLFKTEQARQKTPLKKKTSPTCPDFWRCVHSRLARRETPRSSHSLAVAASVTSDSDTIGSVLTNG